MYIRIKEIKLILLVCLITSSIMSFFIKEACITNVQASSLFMGDGQTKVVMITVDYIDMQDIAEDSYLKQLYDKSYLALISSRQNGKPSASKTKLSIGTGKRLLINSNMVNAVNIKSQSKSLRLQGTLGYVKYMDLQDLKEANKGSEYLGYIGNLGDKLNELNKNTCVLGNSDTDFYNRNNILIAMDNQGEVDYGDVETPIMYDQSFPGGKRTDFTRLNELYNEYLPLSDFLVIDTGDLTRLEYFKSKLTGDEYKVLRKEAVERISMFVRDIIEKEKYDSTFLLVSSYPTTDKIKKGDKLTPIMSYTGNQAGFLYSKSTRREGIITSLDIADYIIEKLSYQNKSQVQELNAKEPLYKIQLLNKRLLNVSLMRLPVLTWYAILEISCAVVGLLFILNTKLMKNTRLMSFIKTTLLVNISAPVVLLYMSALNIARPSVYFAIFIFISYCIAYVINRAFKDTISRFTAAALLVNLSLAADLIWSSMFIKGSVFGYDPIIGARFYGIGNEFAGVYLGSAILAAGCILQSLKQNPNINPKLRNLLLSIYFILQICIVGMPTLGANFGATIASVCGFYFFMHSAWGKQIRGKQMLSLLIIVIIVIGMLIIVDLSDFNNTTHIGRFVDDIKENGIKVLFATFTRKLEMNLRLIKYTIWTKVLLCIILIITIMFFKPVRLLHSIFKKYQYLAAAWLGISAGSIAGLIVNDSGIVMAATAMIFTGYTILYICLEEMESVKAGG